MPKILYTGAEEFIIPSPAVTKRQRAKNKTFLVISTVGSDLRGEFDNEDELQYVNRHRGADGQTRIAFRNLSLEKLAFKPNCLTEIEDEDTADRFCATQWFEVPKHSSKKKGDGNPGQVAKTGTLPKPPEAG